MVGKVGRSVAAIALLMSLTVGFGIGVTLGGTSLASPTVASGGFVVQGAPGPNGWSVAELAASAPAAAPYQEPGMNLAGSMYLGTPKFADPANPTGTTPILVSLNPSNGSALDQLLAELSNPASPQYHQYLTHAQFDAEFGANPAVYRSLVAYLSSFGVTGVVTHPDRLSISFQATRGQIESIFGTTLGAYQSAAGQPYFAPLATPELPALITPYLSGVSGLSNYSEYLVHTDSVPVTEQIADSVESEMTGAAAPAPAGTHSPNSPGSSSNPFTPTTVNGRTYDEPVHMGTAGANCDTTTCGQLMEGADLQVAYNETGLFTKYGYPVNATVVAMLWTDPVCTANSSTCKSDGFYNSFCSTLTSGSYAWDFYMPDVTTYWNYTLPNGEPSPRAVPLPITGSSSYAYPAGSKGYSSSCDDDEAEGENTLDVAMEGSVAPGANVMDVFGQGSSTTTLETEFSDILSPTSTEFSTTGGFDTSKNLKDLGNASIIANSWGSSSSLGTTTTWINDLKEAQTLGITVLASTGDGGGNSLEAPAENSYNTYGAIAVGGTTLVLNPTTLLRTPDHLFSASSPYDGTGGGEIVWYEPDGKVDGFTATYGTVGGVATSSTNYAPKWQNSSADAHGVITTIKSTSYGRGEPDVAAIANDTIVDIEIGYFSANITCTITTTCTKVTSLPDSPTVEHGWTYFIGTSISAQATGGLVGVIDYVLHKEGQGRVGFLDPAAYSMGQLQDTSDLKLHSYKDITLYHNAESSSTYGAFAGWDADTGWGVIDAGNYTQNTLTYPITFTESGLPSGTSWSVTLTPSIGSAACTVSGSTCSNSVKTSSTTSTITFNEPYGTYAYKLGLVSGYAPTPSSGSVQQFGSAVNVGVAFTQVTYPVTFSETGLPASTVWSVTLGSTPGSSSTSSIGFTEPNGTYTYTVGPVPGYAPAHHSGSVTVSGASAQVTVAFSQVAYTVDFSEAGIASGATFEVTVNGVEESLTTDGATDALLFSVPNGTYAYSIANVPGWVQSTLPASGTVTVSGASVTEPTLVYSAITYSVSFSETGLPGGTAWSVTLNGATLGSTGSTIAFSEANGSYGYRIGGVAGYEPDTSFGTVTVSGTSVSVPVAFAPVTYAVTFSENGLPAGQTFGVTVGGVLQSVTTDGGTDSLSFEEPNGSYGYAIAAISGYSQATLPSSGTVSVNGAAVTEPTLEYSTVVYSVTFEETGLASGTSWSVTLGGTPGSSTTGSLAFSEANGTYGFTVGTVAGYTASPSSGSVTVNGAGVTVDIAFGQVTYAVTFSESGLPSGQTFQVTFAGTPQSVTTDGGTDSVAFSAANGTFDYTVAGVAGYHQSTLAYSGSVTVDGAAVSEPTLVFSAVTYVVCFTESGLPSGTSWSVTLNGHVGTSTGTKIQFSEPNGSYAYTIGEVPGYSAYPSSGTVGVSGAKVNVGIAFSPVFYALSFSESGLPLGQTFGVTVNGYAQSVTTTGGTDSLVFSEANGTYAYSIAGIAGYAQTTLPSSGSVTVDGSAVSEPTLEYSQVTYSVTFSEGGLPGGTSWSVTLNGATESSTSSAISFAEPNGTYAYSIGGVAGYAASPASGSVDVNGAGTTVDIAFSAVTYSVSFSESGLPSGASWSVTLDGATQSSTGTTISFSEPNGTYGYSVGAVAGYGATPSSGSVTVNGADQSVSIAYAQSTYSVTFTESGLAGGTSWSVTLNGVTESATSASIVFSEPNGTYDFSVGHVARYSADPASGSVTVDGAAVEQSIAFSATPPDMYALTFTESGLPAGTSWSVTVGATTESSTGATIVFELVNGTYSYSVGAVAGYTAAPASGSVTVNGAAAGVEIGFSATDYTVTFSETGLPATKQWAVDFLGEQTVTTAASVSFTVPDGTYTYLVQSEGAYRVTMIAPEGTVTVNGANYLVTLAFAHGTTYTLTFKESGLATGTSWCVTVGAKSCSTSDKVQFKHLTPGTYTYAIGAVGSATIVAKVGRTSVPATGSISLIRGTTVKVDYTYPVTFTETGLLGDASWKVVAQGQTVTSTATSIVLYLLNGTVTYHLSASGYTATPASGHLTVVGAAQSVDVTFSAHTHHGSSVATPTLALARAVEAARTL